MNNFIGYRKTKIFKTKILWFWLISIRLEKGCVEITIRKPFSFLWLYKFYFEYKPFYYNFTKQF